MLPAEIWHWDIALLWADTSLPSAVNNLTLSPAAKHWDEPSTNLSGEVETSVSGCPDPSLIPRSVLCSH